MNKEIIDNINKKVDEIQNNINVIDINKIDNADDKDNIDNININLVKKSDHILGFLYLAFTNFLFDYIYRYLQFYYPGQVNWLTALFYWQHECNQAMRNFFKSLPVVRDHYYYQPSACKFWYFIVIGFVHSLIARIVSNIIDTCAGKKIRNIEKTAAASMAAPAAPI